MESILIHDVFFIPIISPGRFSHEENIGLGQQSEVSIIRTSVHEQILGPIPSIFLPEFRLEIFCRLMLSRVREDDKFFHAQIKRALDVVLYVFFFQLFLFL